MTIEIIRPADRKAWLDARGKDVTASVAGCLFGVHPYQTAYALWAEKTGRIPRDDEDTPQLRRGRMLEPVIFAMLREDRPDWTVEYPLGNAYYRDTEARIGATPDAFATRPDIFGNGVVQGKTVFESDFRTSWLDPDTGAIEVPLWIAVQVITEAYLTGATWAAVAVMVVGRGIDLHVVDVPVHAGVVRQLKARVAEFWRRADEGREPDIDWLRDGDAVAAVYGRSRPDRVDLTGNHDLDAEIISYLDAVNTRARAEQIANQFRPRILRALGHAEAGFTANWSISAPTSTRTGVDGLPIHSRTLRIKPRENPNASF